MPTGFWWGNLKDREDLEESVVDWWIILKWVNKCGKESFGLTRLLWVMIGTGGGLDCCGT